MSAALLFYRYPPAGPAPASQVRIRKLLPLSAATWGIAQNLYAN